MGCFAMAPFAGRLHQARLDFRGRSYDLPAHAPPHAIHGTAVDSAWSVVESTPDAAVLEYELGSPWPFAGRVTQRLQLSPDRLDAELQLDAAEQMPVVLGWHPWFRRRLDRGADVQLHAEPLQQYVRGYDGLPTGELVDPQPGPHDDCFLAMASPPRLVWPGALELELHSPTDHWVLFDEHPDAVCVEPQTGPPDAVRLGRHTVVPAGGALVLPMSLLWRSADSS